MSAPPQLRVAVIGLGHFAQAAVLPAIAQLPDIDLVALVSSSPHKLAELGDHYSVRRRIDYTGLDALLATGIVDAVYIAVPNDAHAEMTLVAARHGVHVLCEKPMAPTEAECMQMIRACAQHGAKLMIAYRLHFEAANLIAVEVSRGGEVGSPRVFSSTFTQQVRDGNSRIQARRGAGPIFDMGIYCVNAARYLFRAEPIEVLALKAAGRDPRFRSADEAYAVTMRFPDEQLAQFVCSFGATSHARYEVIGTDGVITLDHAYDYAYEMHMRIDGLHGSKVRTFPKRDQIAAEIEYFARCVREDIEPEPSGWEGVADVRILQAIRQSARFGRAIAVDAIPRPHRPDFGQQLQYPSHDEPVLVDVAAVTR
jgi:glucose-fructose oxidoreductase